METPSRAGPRTGRRSFLAGVAGAAGLATFSRRSTATAAFGPRTKLKVDGAKEVVVGDDGTVAYVATTDGFAVFDVSDPANPAVLARVDDLTGDRLDGTIEKVWDVSVDGGRLVACGPAVTIGESPAQGFAVFDVSDPADPQRSAVVEIRGSLHNAFLDGDVVYLTHTSVKTNPMQMYDVADGEPAKVGSFSPANYVDWPSGSVHDVYVVDGTMYATYWDLGTWVVDVSDPADPEPLLRVGYDREADVETGRGELPGNAHYTQPHPERAILAVGKEASDNEETEFESPLGGIELWDVSDFANPSRETILAPPPETEERATGMAHNFGWRGDRLYAAWDAGGVAVYEVADAAEPMRLAGWRDDEGGPFWTAEPVHDGFVGTTALNGIIDERGPPPRLFTFPEPSGEDPTPARTMEPVAPAAATSTFDAATPSPTETPTLSPHPDGETGTPAGTATTTPGFGATATLAAGGVAAWRLLRRERETAGSSSSP